jgi:predicted acyltransferase (DUF342 family)
MQVPLSKRSMDHVLLSQDSSIHAIRGGHVIRPGARVPTIHGNNPDATLWIGSNAIIDGGIQTHGSVVLTRNTTSHGGINAGLQVVIGAGCIVNGAIRCQGNVVVQAGALVDGPIIAGNDVHLLGDCNVQDVNCKGDVFISGSPTTGTLSPKGRIQTRAW